MNKLPHSYSRVKQALTCPLAYRFYLERRETGVEAAILQEGSLFHSFAEAYAKHCMDTNQQTDIGVVRQIARWAYEAMRAEYAARREHFLGEMDFERVCDKLVMPFADRAVFDVANFVEVESHTAVDRTLSLVAWDSPDAWFRARLDLVVFPTARTAKVIDYKAGFAPDVDKLQMQIYAWLIMAIYPHIDEVECELDFVRFNVQKYDSYTREQWPWLNERIQGICARVEAIEAFDPAPGLHCQHCHYRGACDAKATIPGSIEDDAAARQAIEALALMDRDTADLRDRLKTYITDNGNIEHNGAEWGYHVQGGMGFDDATEFVDACNAHGIDFRPFVTVNNTKTKSKKAQALLKPVESLKINKRSTVFKGVKIGNNGESE